MTHIVVAVPPESEGMARAFFVPCASSRMRSRNGPWSFAVLRRYHDVRLNCARRQARCTFTP